MRKKLIVIGGGGHGKSVIDSIRSTKEFDIIGILDEGKSIGTIVSGIQVLGGDALLPELFKQGIYCGVIAVGSMGNPQARIRIYETLKNTGFVIPNIVDKGAVLSHDIQMGEGNFIGKGVILGAGVILGTGCIINTGSILEHGTIIGDFTHIAPGSILCGNVRVGEHVHIGPGSTVIQNVTIKSNSLIGAGSLVLRDISSNTLAYGSPAREVGTFEQSHDYSRSRCKS